MSELRNDVFIVVLPTDTERATVIIDKADYLQKSTTFLNDCYFFLRLLANSLTALTHKISKLLDRLRVQNKIQSNDLQKLRP